MQLTGRRVLVTGGAGFIGSHACRRLLDAGADVHAVDDFFAGRPDLVPGGADVTELDVRSSRVGEVVDEFDPDAVVHLAAIHYIPYCNEHPDEAYDVNVWGTRSVLEAVEEYGDVEQVVYASSAAVYPPRERPNDEDSRLGPMDVYGKTKLLGEDLLRRYSAEAGTPSTALRFFNVYGPDETNEHLIPAVLEQVNDGKRTIELGNLSPKRDFVHVDDVARSVVASLTEYDGSGFRAYNVGTGTVYSVREVVENVAEALGEEIEIVQDQERVRESDRPHLEADVDRIAAELGWEPEREFVDGLEELVDPA